VLRWRSYGESDKIVTFLTRDFGKLTGIGKGAKNSRKRFPNSLEILARVQVQFRQRQEASLAFLESCELLGPRAAPMDPERLAYGAYLTELAEQMTVEWSPALSTYELLDEALRSLEEGPATAALLRAYELKLLECAGFATPLDHCCECGTTLANPDTPEIFFAPSAGSFCCMGCGHRREGLQHDGLQAISAELVARLRTLRQIPLQRGCENSLGPQRDTAAQITGQLLALHLIRPLQSTRTIEQLTRSRS